MAYQEKYSVSKRGQTSGPFSVLEIIDLLRMKEISTIHKVKLGQDFLSVLDFIDQYEKGLLPEQNLDKVFEDEPEKEKPEPQEEVIEEPEPEPEPEPKVIEVPEPSPATEIHINRSGTQFGPYLLKELKDYLKAGNLRFSDLVWFEGVSEWVPLSRIPGVADGLNSLGSAAPPPPKPPPTPAAPGTPPLINPASTAPSALPIKAQAADESEVEKEEVAADNSTEKHSFETGNLAPHSARAIAGLVDGLILFLVVGILIGITGAATEFSGTLVFAGVVAYFLLGWLYYGLGESSQAGGFIGKRMSKIKVVRLSDDQVPGFGISSLRAILKILLSLTIILPFIVFLTPRRQGLHDLACGTIVTGGEKEN